MTGFRVMLMSAAALTAGTLGGAAPASAQYLDAQYYEDGYGPPPGYGYGGPRYPRYGWRGGGSLCVTARGNCASPPAPLNAPCGCMIPGFGLKRGQIGG